MKTIDEAAKESVQHRFNLVGAIKYGDIYKQGFKAGACAAQRWIPVEEELPKEGDEVLTKTSDNWHRILTFGSYGKGGFPSQVTHWRPIEI